MTLSYPAWRARRPSAVEHPGPPVAREPVVPRGGPRVAADEWRTLARLPWLPLHLPALLRAPRGDGGVVVDIPGWRAPEASMAPLRTYLRLLGHDARTWGLGTNTGRPERDAERLAERVADLAERGGRPVALVGWSLGGVVARETARLLPDAVRAVVHYGTPVVGGPTWTAGAGTIGQRECRRLAELSARYDAQDPLRVPVTAVFTRQDRVVDWAACIDRTSLDVRHVEVGSTHLGMGVDPAVWLTVARALAP